MRVFIRYPPKVEVGIEPHGSGCCVRVSTAGVIQVTRSSLHPWHQARIAGALELGAARPVEIDVKVGTLQLLEAGASKCVKT